MGCGQSKIESEESVTRCKDRKEFMKKALSSRNAFAAAHSAYSVSLRNTGAALADYAHSEAHLFANPPSSSSAQNPQPASSSNPSPSSSNPAAAATIVQPPVDAPLPPPPPPLPDFTRLQRAASMPEFAIPNNKHAAASKAPADDVIQEEDGDADDEDEGAGDEPRRRRSSTSNNDEARPPPVATVQQQQQPPPPAAEKTAPVWLGDYIFNTDHMPGPSLSQPEPEETQQIPKAKEKVVIEQPPEPTLPPPEPEVKVPPPAPKLVRKQRVQQQPAAMVGGEGKRGRGVGNSVNVKKVFDDIDDHFLKASESAHDVSKMLEATRMHYHSNFADNRGETGFSLFSLLIQGYVSIVWVVIAKCGMIIVEGRPVLFTHSSIVAGRTPERILWLQIDP